MNVFIVFSASHYFPPTDGKAAVKLAALKVGGSPGGAWHNKDLAGTMAPVSCLKADPSSLFQEGSNTALETERILFLGHTWFGIVLWDMTLNVYQTMS